MAKVRENTGNYNDSFYYFLGILNKAKRKVHPNNVVGDTSMINLI